jgi:conjugal transfer pilus assembly protein TraF
MRKKAHAYFLTTMLVLVLMCNLRFVAPAYGDSDDTLGWRWYHDPELPQDEVDTVTLPLLEVETITTLSPTEQMDWYHRYYDDVKNDAVLHPDNPHKVAHLMQLNQFMQQQASQYGMTMKQVLLADPKLSYTLRYPTEQSARHIFLAQQREQQIDTTKALAAAGYGLLFFYRGNDPMAQTLAPSIQAFADTYGIEVLGIAQDGITLSSIAHNRIDDKGITVPASPALILANTATGTLVPLAYGFIDQATLLGRLVNVASGYQADF